MSSNLAVLERLKIPTLTYNWENGDWLSYLKTMQYSLIILLAGFHVPSRKHLRTKVTLDFHLTYSKNGGDLGSESKC